MVRSRRLLIMGKGDRRMRFCRSGRMHFCKNNACVLPEKAHAFLPKMHAFLRAKILLQTHANFQKLWSNMGQKVDIGWFQRKPKVDQPAVQKWATNRTPNGPLNETTLRAGGAEAHRNSLPVRSVYNILCLKRVIEYFFFHPRFRPACGGEGRGRPNRATLAAG